MKKKIIALALIIAVVFSTNVFAYRWVKADNDWYVYDDATGEKLSNILLDTGDNVYYLDDTGKMVVGWWKNPATKKIYFFDNNVDRSYGGMVFGLHMIDGYYRYFGDDGSLQTSGEPMGFRKVYLDFWADYVGNLYFNNELLRDESVDKSEYYTKTEYYTNSNLNNFYLAKYDVISVLPDDLIAGNGNNSTTIDTTNNSDKVKTSASTTAGGTDYYVDREGHVTVPDHTGTIGQFEIYGPARFAQH